MSMFGGKSSVLSLRALVMGILARVKFATDSNWNKHVPQWKLLHSLHVCAVPSLLKVISQEQMRTPVRGRQRHATPS